MSRRYAWALTIIVLVAVSSPMVQNFREDPQDSFPLSYYPMFSHAHPEVQKFTYLVGVDAEGNRIPIHYRYAGKGGMNQVRKQISKTVRRGNKSARRLCRSVARKIAGRREPAFADLTEIRVVTGAYRPVDYFAQGGTEPISERVHAVYRIRRVEDLPDAAAFPAWLETHVDGLEWEDRPPPARLSRQILEDSLALGRQFLINNQKPEGNFNYRYDFVTGEVDRRDSQVRQAGALWGLALIHQYEQDPLSKAALDRGLRFFFECTRPGRDAGSLLVAYPGESKCRTGTVALVALAIIEYLRTEEAGMPAAYRDELERYLAGYLTHLKAMRLANRRFAESYSLRDGMRSHRSSPYFDGEVMLCLIKAARYLGYTELIPLIEDSALEMARHYTVNQWVEDPDSDLTKGFFQWSCLAFSEYREARWRNSETFGDYVLALAWWMIHVHETLQRNRNTAYAYEGIIPAYRLARLRGHEAAARELAYVIDEGLAKLTSWQVGGPLAYRNEFLAAHATDDPLAVGGVMNHRREAPLRIDVAQHQMHAVILALEHAYPPADGGSGP